MCHHAATRAPPRALSWAQAGTGCWLIFLCPVMQRGLDPRDLIPEDGSLGLAPRGWIPVHGSQGTLQCRTSLLQKAQQPLPGGVQGRGSAKAGGSLQQLPWFWVPVAVVTLGQGSGLAWPWLLQRQRRAGQGCCKPSFLSNGCCNLEAPQGFFSPSFPPKNKGQQRGEPSPVQGVVPAPDPSWVRVAGGAGPDAGAHGRDAASASHQAAGAAGAVIDGLFISFSPAQDVSVRLRRIFLGLAAPSILPRLLLPPGSSLSRPGGLKPVQTQGWRSRELLSHSPWFLPMGRAGLGSASLGMDQAKVGASQLQALLGTGTRTRVGRDSRSFHMLLILWGREGAGRDVLCGTRSPTLSCSPPSPSPSCPALHRLSWGDTFGI